LIPKTKYSRIIGIIITFHFVCFCWIFFRSSTFANSWIFIEKIIFQFKPVSYIEFAKNYYAVFVLIGVGFILHFIPTRIEEWYKKRLINSPVIVKVIYLFICIFIAIQFKQADAIKPIYLQF